MEDYLMLVTQHPNYLQHKNEELIQQFYYAIDELFYEFIPAIANRKYDDAIELVNHCYLVWNQTNIMQDLIGKKDFSSIANLFSQLIVFALAAELAWLTHYSLQTASGLTVLTISMGIRITTPSYESVGVFSNGFFNYRVVRRQGYFITKTMKR